MTQSRRAVLVAVMLVAIIGVVLLSRVSRVTAQVRDQVVTTLDDRFQGEVALSQLSGHFVLRDATLSFSNLTFAVPGAVVQLSGTYQIEHETLDFAGQLLLDASLAETTSGTKPLLATIAQPFHRKGGGSTVPICISGTRVNPSFGLDVRRALLPG
jgi:hypothetical protein